MSDLLDKLSSYNIFNYLLPGTLFAAAGSAYTSYNFTFDNLFIVGFAYYFFGLVISRVGSLVVEPVLKYVGFLEFAEYGEYVKACTDDKSIVELSEANNIYRTLLSLFLFLGGLFLVETVVLAYPATANYLRITAFIALVLLFLFSYRKQTRYISKRVSVVRNKSK